MSDGQIGLLVYSLALPMGLLVLTYLYCDHLRARQEARRRSEIDALLRSQRISEATAEGWSSSAA